MKKEIIICPKCDNHKIKDYFDRSEQRYKCLSCGRSFKDTTKKTRTVVDSDYFIVKTDEDKKKLYDFLFVELKNRKNKNTIFL